VRSENVKVRSENVKVRSEKAKVRSEKALIMSESMAKISFASFFILLISCDSSLVWIKND
jgi:hypothetical protein